MLDTKNPDAKPIELTLTNLPSNFKFTPMGLGQACLNFSALLMEHVKKRSKVNPKRYFGNI